MVHRIPPPTGSGDAGWWAREIVQREAEDVVVAAARFKPNAAGRFDLSPGGFAQRALLKSRGIYLAERLVIGVTPLHVHAVRLVFGGRLARSIGRWARDAVEVVRVACHGREDDPTWPALRISQLPGRVLAEVQPLQRDDETARLVEFLLSRASVSGVIA